MHHYGAFYGISFLIDGVIFMSWSYKRLKHLMVEKDITRTQLLKMTGASKNVFTKISKNEPLNMATIGRICEALHCRVEDILEWIYEEDKN